MVRPVPIDLPAPLAGVRVVAGPPGSAAPGRGGRRAGARGVEAERAGLAQARQALERAAALVAGLQEQIVAEAESHLLDLAMNVARRVLAQEIEAGHYAIEPIIREAIRGVPARREVVVRLNPQDLKAMQGAPGADAEAGQAALPANVRLVADPAIGRAECVVDMAEGTVEAGIDGKLDQIRRTLKGGE